MKTPLAPVLKEFFQTYLRDQCALSPHTIKSYRDGFKILLAFLRARAPRKPGFFIEDLNPKTLLAFFQHLEDAGRGRGNGVSTRNQRLAAVQSFFRYLALVRPSLDGLARRVAVLPRKRGPRRPPEHLNRREMEALLDKPDEDVPDGARDAAILTLLYNTGARAQEVADLRVGDLNIGERLVTLTGKGRKTRVTPLWPSTVQRLRLYLRRQRRKPRPEAKDRFFINQRGGAFTRFGIHALVARHIRAAANNCPSLRTKRLSTHSLRHTTAVHLLESNVDPNVIKAWLGHASVKSTDRYLDTDVAYKRKILDQFGPPDYVASPAKPKVGESARDLAAFLDHL